LNATLLAAKSKLETDYGSLQSDFDEVSREWKGAEERAVRAQGDLNKAVEQMHEEQERAMKYDTMRKALEGQVKELQVRLQEMEASALIGGKRLVTKLEGRIRDLENEFEEERRRHAETQKICAKKERRIKEVQLQGEEDRKNVVLLQDGVEKLTERCKILKRQADEAESLALQNVTKVRKFQREMEAAEDRADMAESNLSLIRAKHRTSVTTSSGGAGRGNVYVLEERQDYTSSSRNY